MQHTASKLDWLKGRKDFNTNPVARAATRLLEHQYAPHGDALYPWILREIRKGNIQLPQPYRTEGGWMELVKNEIAAEQELARREAWIEEHPDEPTPDSWSWDEDHKQIDWDDLDHADWNQLTDYLRWLQEAQSGEGSGWEMLHKAGGGQRFDINHPGGAGYRDHRQPLAPDDLKRWDKVLADRAKRRKAVDPMQFSAGDFAANMNDQWYPEYEDKLRGDSGDVVHQFPDKWTIRRLRDEKECEQEGEDMGHCVGDCGDWVEKGNTHIFSLRDPKNRPHTTLEIKPRSGQPDPEYDIWDKYGVPPHRGWVETVNMLANGGLDDADTQARLRLLTPESDMWKLCQIAQETRERQQQQAPSQPWHDGQLTQVYGKEDEPPKAEYQQRLRDWFEAMPDAQQPTNLEDTPYHPEAVPSHWRANDRNWGAAWPEEENPVPVPDAHVGNVHYPGLSHKSRVHGRICHCPWGSKERPWSWSAHESAIEWDDGLDPGSAGQRGRRERLPARSGRGVGSAWDLPAATGGTGDAGERPEDSGDPGQVGGDVRAGAPATSGRRSGVHRAVGSRSPRTRRSAYANFQDLVAAWSKVITVFATEMPTEVEVTYMELVDPDAHGQGIALRFAQDAQRYAAEHHKRLIVPFQGYLLGQVPGFVPITLEDGTEGAMYDPSTTSKTRTCPTCGDRLQGEHGTFCPRCSWTETDANLDSDPLSNPPDPTVDMARGIQSRTVVADKLHDFLMNPKSRPDLQTPRARAFLAALEQRFHNEKTDALMPWLTREWKQGRLEVPWFENALTDHPVARALPDDVKAALTHYHHGKPLPAVEGFNVPGLYDALVGEPESNHMFYTAPHGRDAPLRPENLNHWADFLRSNHPLRRDMGDHMKQDITSFGQRVQDWDAAMLQEAHQRGLEGGQVVHTTPDDWTVRQLTQPEELKAEGDAMGHCVGGYGSQVQNGDSLIYSLRDPEGRPHVTTEIEPTHWQDPPGPTGEPGRIWGGDAGHQNPEFNMSPVPHGGEVVQIQGRGNQDPKDEYKARMKDWFDTFPEEHRPTWADSGEVATDIGDIRPEHLIGTDEYGLKTAAPFANYAKVLDSMIEGRGGYREPQYDEDHGKKLYQLARRRGEVPELASALGTFGQEQQDNFDQWRDMNYGMTVGFPQGDEEYPLYHAQTGKTFDTPEEHEQAYSDDEAEWIREHAGMQATSHMYELLQPHYYDGAYQQEPRQAPPEPPQAPQAFSSTVPSHRWGKWLQAVEDAP